MVSQGRAGAPTQVYGGRAGGPYQGSTVEYELLPPHVSGSMDEDIQCLEGVMVYHLLQFASFES